MSTRSALTPLLAALLGTALFTGCAPAPQATNPEPPPPTAEQPSVDQPAEQPAAEPSSRAWLDTELTDVSTGRTFTLAEFKGRPVLLHAFAVW